nr:LEA family epithelial adhesin [Limosilactobacillus vaginalis]
MKRPEFLETKRTPRYSLRKLNVGVASVLLGVTIFGINFTDHSVKAATKAANPVESVRIPNDPPTGNLQQASAAVLKPAEQTSTTEKVQQSSASNDATEEVQQNSASNDATANNSTEAATTSQSSPKTQSSADTDIRSLDIRSLTAISAAKLAIMNLTQTNGITGTGRTATGTHDTGGTAAGTPGTGTSGTYRSAAGTVSKKDNSNTQLAKENQKLANDHNLTSSDNYSSNIYKGKDGKYYKIVTIYGDDYVYRAADIQANGTAALQSATTAGDTKNNIDISKEDLGNGKTRWKVVFFPKKGLQNVGSKLSGLSSAKFGIALTSDYQIVGNVDMKVISDPNKNPTFDSYTFEPGSTSATESPIQNLQTEKDFSFDPKTDVDQNTGLINSETMPAYNNQYLQGPYYFTTDTDIGKENLWQTYFKDWGHNNDAHYNAYDGSPYVGNVHGLYVNNFVIKNETGDVDGAKNGDKLIYDRLGYSLNSKNGVANSNGVFSSDNFTQAMEFKSQGVTSNAQFSSYVISFTTQHTDSHEVQLSTGWKNQQFSGISANIYSNQNRYYNMFSRLYGEQRALTPADAAHPYAPVNPKDIIPGWVPANEAMGQIKQDYLNNAQINVLRNKILNNITDPGAVKNIIKEGNSLNDAMKNLGNSIGQYDPDNKFADHKEDTTKGSDRYKYADPDKKAVYDNVTEVTKALINKDTGTYADQATVETLTTDENNAWSALDGKKPTDTESYHVTAKDPVSVDKGAKVDPGSLVNVTDPAGKPVELPAGSIDWKDGAKPDLSTSGDKTGKVEVTLPDGSKKDTDVTIHVKSDAESYHVTAKDPVSVDKGAKVDPGSLVNVTDPAGKPVELPAGSIDWKDGAKPDLSTSGDKTGKVEVTLPDGSKKDTDVTIHVKTDAETYDPKAQPWTTTVGKTPKADEVISSTDKNGTKMPSDAKYTWKTEPNTSKTGEASGEVTVTYNDGSQDDVPVTINVKDKLDDNEKYHIYGKDGLKVNKDQTLDPKDAIDVRDADGNETTLPEGSNVVWTKKPEFSQAGKDVTGEVTVTYPDHTKSDPVTVTVHVNGESDNYKVAPRDGVTVQRGGQVDPEKTVVAQTPDGKPTSFPDKTKHEWITKPDTDSTGKRTGVVKTTFPDGSTTTTTVSVTVEPNQSDNYDPKGPKNPDDRVPVKDPEHLTKGDKDKVKGEVGTVNPNLPKGTEVEVDDKGNATIKYPDHSTDTIKGSDLVRPATDAEKTTPKVPAKEPVADPSHLTTDEQAKVQKNVEDANKDENGKSTLPEGTTVTVGSDGTATVTYPDHSKDTIPGDQLVQGQKGDTTDAGNITPTVPGDKVTVKDPSHLTDDEKKQVKNNVDNANKDKFPAGTDVTVGDDGTATVNYPDGSKDTIPGDQLVQGQKGDTTDAGNITPTVPGDKVTVKDPSHLTEGEKDQVKTNVTNANKDKFPAGTEVTVGDDGTATINYPDGSTNTIPGHDLVTGKTDADKYPLNPGQAVDVVDPNHLTQAEQDQVKEAIRTANPTAPIATITVDAAGNVQVTFADGSTTTLQANLHKHVTEATTGSATKPGAGTNGNQMKGATSTNQTATKQQAQQHLPQTGDQPATWAMLSGLGVAFLGLLGLKKKRED